MAVQSPDRAGRKLILAVHTRAMPIADDVDLGRLAASTPGMVGADLAPLLPGMEAASEHTQRLVDAEVRRIVTAAHEDVTTLLQDHRDQLDSLVEHETLDEDEAHAAAGIEHHTNPIILERN